MNRAPRLTARSSNLCPSTHQRLNMYALAAGAAGVSVLAITQSAEAKIVYTPAHVSILGPHGLYRLDLNHDGAADFFLANRTSYNTDQAFWNLSEHGAGGNAAVGTFVYRGFPKSAHAFKKDDQIGSSQKFFSGREKLASFYFGGGGSSARGNWVNVTNRYLGLRFQIAGQKHYGWARLNVQVLRNPIRINALLTGYAYEDAPDTPIIAGQTSNSAAENTPNALNVPTRQPAVLGVLAMGSPGLFIWRREESGAVVQ